MYHLTSFRFNFVGVVLIVGVIMNFLRIFLTGIAKLSAFQILFGSVMRKFSLMASHTISINLVRLYTLMISHNVLYRTRQTSTS